MFEGVVMHRRIEDRKEKSFGETGYLSHWSRNTLESCLLESWDDLCSAN